MVKCSVLFEARAEYLNIIYTSFGFKGLNRGFISLNSVNQLIFVMVKCSVLFEVRADYLNVWRQASTSKGDQSGEESQQTFMQSACFMTQKSKGQNKETCGFEELLKGSVHFSLFLFLKEK
jgi:hypothetical protein